MFLCEFIHRSEHRCAVARKVDTAGIERNAHAHTDTHIEVAQQVESRSNLWHDDVIAKNGFLINVVDLLVFLQCRRQPRVVCRQFHAKTVVPLKGENAYQGNQRTAFFHRIARTNGAIFYQSTEVVNDAITHAGTDANTGLIIMLM